MRRSILESARFKRSGLAIALLGASGAAAVLLASQMSEKEAIDIAAFFASPTGKKYLSVEPVFIQKFGAIADPWRQQLSQDIIERARAEMKKKGVDF